MTNQRFVVDLCKIQGVGDFPCPKCGAKIDPDDDDANFQVIDPDLEDGLLIECARCKTRIEIVGLGPKEKAKPQ